MRKVDQNTWDRKEVFDFFSNVSNPFYMTSFRVDVTDLVKYTKRNNCSFYFSLIYLCNKAFNNIENFLYAINDGEVVLLDARHPSFTDRKQNSELFKMVTVKAQEDMIKFCDKAKETSEKQKCFVDLSSESNDLIYYSCLPTLRLTGLTNEFDYSSPKLKDDNIPRVAWGKYEDINGKYELTMSLEVNHRFIDGLHIEKFAQMLEESIRELANK